MREQPDVPLFELDGVGLTIDGKPVLDDLTLAVPDDGITVLLGPSGAGKTMILRLLNRLEVPTTGSVRFRGERVDQLDPLTLRRRVGMVFQRPTVFPGTVRSNLLVAQPEATEDELTAVLEAVDLRPGMIDRVADELSGGEAQRVCLARTLATHPEVLLMDEPTSALDPEARYRLEATARALADQGTPMVWVTHDLDQADRLADHRLVVIEGRVASPEEMAEFTANGHGPEDRTEGRAEGRSDDRADDGPEGRSDDRAEGRSDDRADDGPEGRSDDKAEGRSDDRAEGRSDDRAEGRSDDSDARDGESAEAAADAHEGRRIAGDADETTDDAAGGGSPLG